MKLYCLQWSSFLDTNQAHNEWSSDWSYEYKWVYKLKALQYHPNNPKGWIYKAKVDLVIVALNASDLAILI